MVAQVAEGAPPRLCHGYALYKHYYNNGIIIIIIFVENECRPTVLPCSWTLLVKSSCTFYYSSKVVVKLHHVHVAT